MFASHLTEVFKTEPDDEDEEMADSPLPNVSAHKSFLS
jgi:hypothetical protein